MTDSRVSTLKVEVLVKPTPDTRVSTQFVEVLVKTVPDVRVATQFVEVLTKLSTKTIKTNLGGTTTVLQMKHPDGTWRGVTYL